MIPELRRARDEAGSLVQTLRPAVPTLGYDDDFLGAPVRKPEERGFHQARTSPLAVQVSSDAHQPDLADAVAQVT